MQCGRFPNLPFVIATGPTRISIPCFRAPSHATSAAPATGCGSCGYSCGSPHGQYAGDGQFALDALERRTQLVVRDRPVDGDAVARTHLEIGRMEPRDVPREMRHRAPHADARVVLSKLDRIAARDDAVVRPVQACLTGSLLVADPVAVGVPERPLLEHDDLPPAARETLGNHAAAGARPDHHEIDDVLVAVPRHPVEVLEAALARVEQDGRVVLGREAPQSSPHFFASRTGS
jgi:hypothetical protein